MNRGEMRPEIDMQTPEMASNAFLDAVGALQESRFAKVVGKTLKGLGIAALVTAGVAGYLVLTGVAAGTAVAALSIPGAGPWIAAGVGAMWFAGVNGISAGLQG